ncbi:hypothetical protein A2U01_0064429, partial [Trifolium medium]|nr:hypothetical protein [Trifolium medium]
MQSDACVRERNGAARISLQNRAE